jgi:vacuolar-type H+-ATPase subunit H
MSGETSRNRAGGTAALAVVLLLALVFVSPAMAERRTALVIGNSTYINTPLKNTVNDARAISDALEAVGFKVTTLLNGDQREMHRAIIRFGRDLEQGGVGLFYYAGHAVQVRQKNFMIPIGAHITVEDHVEPESVDLNKVIGRMAGARNRMNIVILDACRNNPFREMFRFYSEGLAQTPAPARSYVAYAAAPGALAVDGTGTNSFYTGVLVQVMKQPDLTIEEVFKQVRSEVISKTSGFQVPWSASSITEDFYFVPGEPEQSPKVANRGSLPNPIDREVVFWQSILESDNPLYFQAYLAQFPDGLFAQSAQTRFRKLTVNKGSGDGAVKSQAMSAEVAETTGGDWLAVIDEALTGAAKQKNVDYVEQIHAAVMVFKDQLRKWTKERQNLAEMRRKAIAQAKLEADKAYENVVIAARRKSEAAQRKILVEAKSAAAIHFRNALADAREKATAAAEKVVAETQGNADAAMKAAMSAATMEANSVHRDAVSAAEKNALESHRTVMAKAEEDAERVRQKILSRAKANADKTSRKIVAEATSKADKVKHQRLVAARKTAELQRKKQIALGQEKARKFESEWVAAAERKAGAERVTMLDDARKKAEAERERILADGREKAVQARERRLANLVGPEPFPENQSVSDAQQDLTGTKGGSFSEPGSALGSAATGDGEASGLQRVVSNARESARQRGEDVAGQARAVLEAVKKFKEGEPVTPAAPIPHGIGIMELDPKLKIVMEKAMSRAEGNGADYSDQVRAALDAVKAHRRQERDATPASVGQKSDIIPDFLRSEALGDPELAGIIRQAMEQAQSEGKDYNAQVRSVLSAIKAYKLKNAKPTGR